MTGLNDLRGTPAAGCACGGTCQEPTDTEQAPTPGQSSGQTLGLSPSQQLVEQGPC